LYLALTACLSLSTVAARGDEEAKESPMIDAAAMSRLAQSFDKVEVQEYPWGWIRWLMNAELDPDARMTLGIVQVNAGSKNPPHFHGNCDEILYVLSGSCRHALGKQSVVMKPGDVLRIPKGVHHGVEVLGEEPLKVLVVYNTGERQFEVVED
jgi:mannose-6-phosphate isomerase-like protein (cupin superfamily)